MIALVPGQSSSLESVGYCIEAELLRIRFRDGSVYDYPDTPAEIHAALMAAPSKGKYLRTSGLAKRGCKIGVPLELAPAQPVAVGGNNVVDPPGDPCCGKSLNAALLAGLLDAIAEWQCGKCNTLWRPTIAEGVRIWRPIEWMAIL